MPSEKLDELLPPFTAGDLPSTVTFCHFEEAMQQDDIDQVKAELAHVWCHYQALELQLASEENNITGLRRGTAELELEGEDKFELAARVYARAMVLAAYETAHTAGEAYVLTGIPLDVIFRDLYRELDFVATSDKEAAANASPEDFNDPTE